MDVENYPIDKIREQFPALQRIEHDHFVGYFDGPGGTQVAKSVIEQMATYMKNGVANVSGNYTTSMETAILIDEARQHVASLLGTKKETVAFGANMTTLAFHVSRALSKEWQRGKGNIVVTEMDHQANIDPWVTAAKDRDVEVRFIPLDTKTFTLDTSHLDEIITEDTVFVALGLASNAIGTITDCKPIIERAKEVGAIVALDGVHAVPHFPVHFHDLGADILFCSAYKFFGPHVGIVTIKEELFDQLDVYKVRPAPEHKPQKLETGTINFEGLIGVTEAIKFIASLGEGNILEEKIKAAYAMISEYEDFLAEHLRFELSKFDHITLYQADETVQKTPTVAFRVHDMETKLVCHHLSQSYALHLEYGNFYAETLVDKLQVGEGGLLRAGISPYNTLEEIERLIEAVASLKR